MNLGAIRTSGLTHHATAVSLRGGGVLLRGVSGSGKSDLALRLMDRGGILIADDAVLLDVETGCLFAAVPEKTAGLLEVRGVGLVRFPHVLRAQIHLCCDLLPPGEEPERLPEPAFADVEGVSLPCLRLDARAPSAAIKVETFLTQAIARDL